MAFAPDCTNYKTCELASLVVLAKKYLTEDKVQPTHKQSRIKLDKRQHTICYNVLLKYHP